MKKKYTNLYKVFILLILISLLFSNKNLTQEIELLVEKNQKLTKTIEEYEISIDELKNNKEELEKELEEIKKNITENKNVIFNEKNLMHKSNIKIDQLEKILKNTGLQGLAYSYLAAEEQYGINAIFLVGLTAQESGWGESNRATRDNNLSGYAVYSSVSRGARFNSKHESIMTTAELLTQEYLNEDGKYFSGMDIYSVNETYCPEDDYLWSNNIVKISNNIVDELNNP